MKLKLERAAMLVDGLSGERIRWETSVQELDGMFDSLPGDCLIATAFVSYLGPFVSNYRDELVRIWTAEVTFYKGTNGINNSVRNHFQFAYIFDFYTYPASIYARISLSILEVELTFLLYIYSIKFELRTETL